MKGAINALNTGLVKQQIPLTIKKSGVELDGNRSRCTKAGNVVTLNLGLWCDSGWTDNSDVTATIPKEYAPSFELMGTCLLATQIYGLTGIGYFYINSNGNIQIANKLNLQNVKIARVNVSYEI